ncbi:response regulator transcription factor [Bradyrhizobium elkanii]|nr:response regulator [Bradyrhizobium elkanii]
MTQIGFAGPYASSIQPLMRRNGAHVLDSSGLSTQEDVIVHIIDDDLSVQVAISELLGTVGLDSRTYMSAHQFLSADRPDLLGCIVLDVRLPGGQSGLDLQEKFVKLGIRLPVVLTTGYGDVAMSVRAMKAGAVDFLPKPFRAQDMIDAVAIALQRDRQRRVIDMELAKIRRRFATLSSREKQIMALVTMGLMNKQVAWKLRISEAAAKISRSALMRKMDARSMADLVRMATQLGLQQELPSDLTDRDC